MCKKLIYLASFVLVLGLVLTSVAEAVDPDLVGWWKLDETSGTIAYDSSGNGNDGTLQGDPQWVAGEMGGAIELDGSGDYVEVPHSESLNISDAVTVALWVYDTDPAGGRSLICKGTLWYESYGLVLASQTFISQHGAPCVRSGLFSGVNTKYDGFSSNGPLPLDEWTHIAVTFDVSAAGNNQKIYFNGVLDAENRSTTPLETNTANVLIGADGWGGGRWYWQGMIDDVRIYSRALTEAEIQQVMLGIPPGSASNPSPADEATDVPRDVTLSWTPGEFVGALSPAHKVFLGESFDDVNDGIGGVTQNANSYTPAQRLDFGKTYYWRIDEANSVTAWDQGNVWQFTVEPVAYPIPGTSITATASSSGIDQGPENTVNGSGLDNDRHSTELTDMWISDIAGPQPTWIQYEFDKVCKLHQMWVWNHNSLSESAIGFGVKDATIEYSADGANWTTLGTTHEFARAPGAAGYAYNTTVDLGGVAVKYVRLTANSNWGGLLPQYGLSEVRFFSIPVQAREPSPDSGATDVDVDVTLGFRAGREAAEHNVYLSTDEQAVIDESISPVSVPAGSSYASYDTGTLDLVQSYYWKINEVNDAETTTTWQGDIWNFTTLEYLVVDDFELYNDLNPEESGSNRIFNTWIDGYDNPAINGSVVGYADAPFVEQSIVYSGNQSMPLNYDNSTAGYSEATANVADLQVGQDWTRHGIKALTLRFSGDPNNAVQQMYVKLNGSKVTYDGDAENIRQTGWQMWYIDLASLGVSLSNVTELSIGFERSGAVGGQGVVYFDGIRLYPFSRQLITPAEPSTAGLVGHYELDGNANDSSGNNNHGTLAGDPQWVAGHIGSGALHFDGRHDYVDLGDPTSLQITGNITMAAWIKTDAPEDDYDIILAKGYTQSPDGGIFLRLFDGNYDTGSWHGGANDPYMMVRSVGGAGADIGQWVHLAGTYDGSNWNLYKNGQLLGSSPAGTGSVGAVEVNAGWAIGSRGGGTADRLFGGLIDDARIYDRALSWAELAWLAGRTKPFDKPF